MGNRATPAPQCINTSLTKGRTLLLIFIASAIFLFISLQLTSIVASARGKLLWSSDRSRFTGATPLDEKEVAELLGRVETTSSTLGLSSPSPSHTAVSVSQSATGDSHTSPPSTEAPSGILVLLQEIEQEQLLQNHLDSGSKPIAVIRGSNAVVDRDLPMYKQGLEKAGFEVRLAGHLNAEGLEHIENADWTLLLCLAFNDGDGSSCMLRATIANLKAHQKISRIPGIRSTLWKKVSLCRSTMSTHHLPALMQSPMAPMCWTLPSQYDNFLGAISALGSKRQWVFKPLGPAAAGQATGLIQVMPGESETWMKRYSNQPAIVQELIAEPFLVDGFHVSIRTYVLVTSASPLRVYWHQEGLVYFRRDESGGFKKVHNRRWFFAQLRQYLARHFGDFAEEKAFSSMEQAIVKCLLTAEADLAVFYGGLAKNPNENLYRCNHCFQLLGVDLILDKFLNASIMEINGQPDMRESTKKDGWASNTIKAAAIEEMFKLLFAREEAAVQLASALEHLKKHVGLEDINCHKEDMLCLTREDLEYMLATIRQNRGRGNFIQIYPSISGDVYDSLLKDLSHSSQRRSPYDLLKRSRKHNRDADDFAIRQRWRDGHDTSVLHTTLTALEHFFEAKALGNYQQLRDLMVYGKVRAVKEITSEQKVRAPEKVRGAEGDERTESAPAREDLDVPEKEHEKKDFIDSLVGNVFGGAAPDKTKLCVKDPAALKLLESLSVTPGVLEPSFSATTNSYLVTVVNEVKMVHVAAHAAHCHAEFRQEKLKGTDQPFNWSLSVGDNYINILVVSLIHTEPWVVNKYVINIRRQGLMDHEPRFDGSQSHQVCNLLQDCDLKVYPKLPCGITYLSSSTWSQHNKNQESLPLCTNAYAPGRWVLPCTRCAAPETCFWREAKWLARECRYVLLNRGKMKHCMKDKKLLFIGDSTVRGMMFRLIEEVNGTLYTWNKAHSVISYQLPKNTSLAFSYYPQFFKPKSQQPVFDKVLHTLLRSLAPLNNDSRTVLVIGGVQWLSTHHLQVVRRALKKASLDNITVVIKMHGSGFNLPVSGIIYSNLAKTQKLLYRHRIMLNASLEMGFIPVDTFSMTLPRHKHFLYGRCACHFHTVVKLDEHDNPVADKTDSPIDRLHYHIDGPINSFYTGLMAAEVCRRDGIT